MFLLRQEVFALPFPTDKLLHARLVIPPALAFDQALVIPAADCNRVRAFFW